MGTSSSSSSSSGLITALILGGVIYYLDMKGIINLGLANLLGRPASTIPVPSSPTPTTTTPTPTTSSSPTPAGGIDANGIRLLYKTTGKKVAMKRGTAHRNGQRFNVTHSFANYMMIGYFKTTSNQKQIEMKTDGPCHGCGGNPCTSLPTCMWYEPDLYMDGTVRFSGEFPHPKNQVFPNAKLDVNKPLGVSLKAKWIGYAVVAYTNAAKQRVIEQWADPDPFDAAGAGKPKNGWVLTLKATDRGDGTMFPKQYFPRTLPVNFKGGLEAEIRMHAGAPTPGADMKWCNVYEIVPPN